ncbi:MAG: hypothetical protein R2720_01365 [Candidatus Nanopelagicales bacterium]
MMGYYDNGWNGWMVAMMMLWPVVLALGIWAVIAVTRDRRSSSPVATDARETPMGILNRRLAAGEITEDEYMRARRLVREAETTGHGAQ